jgi:large subunit ribosomal protein L4
MKTTTYTKSGNKGSELTLDKTVFGAEANTQLIQLAYNRFLNNARTNNAKVLTRSEVRGGGRKPWRQKGTGRARTGSIRNPLWRTGGIIFGPTGLENYSQDMPRKMARAALVQALSVKADSLRVVEKFDVAEFSTKAVIGLLSKLDVTNNVLLVADDFSETFRASSANIAGVTSLKTKSLNVYDVMNADNIVIEKAALDTLKDWLVSTKKKEAKAEKAEVAK